MEFADLLRQRRMVRHYLPDPIPRETIERIVAVVRRAPSGGFSKVASVKDLLGIPDDVHFVCVLTIGVPAPVQNESERVSRLSRRLALDELVRWERWA